MPDSDSTSDNRKPGIRRLPTLGSGGAYLDAMYEQWRKNPNSVPDSWRYFFEGVTFAERVNDRTESLPAHAARAQSNVASLIFAYRSQGHLIADTNPIKDAPASHPTLDSANWGFAEGGI